MDVLVPFAVSFSQEEALDDSTSTAKPKRQSNALGLTAKVSEAKWLIGLSCASKTATTTLKYQNCLLCNALLKAEYLPGK